MSYVELLVVVTPDGRVTYCKPGRGAADKVMQEFRDSVTPEQKAAHTKARTIGGVVAIRVLEEDAAKLEVRP